MATEKISALAELTTPESLDEIPIVDKSDTGTAASGKTKRVVASKLSAINGVDGGALTVAAGVVAVGSASRYQVDTEGSAAVSTVNSISGGVEGQIVTFSIVSALRRIAWIHSSGVISLDGGRAVVQADTRATLTLQKRGSGWVEIARSQNMVKRAVGDGSTFLGSDAGRPLGLVANSGSPVALGVPADATESFPVDTMIPVTNLGAGLVTITVDASYTLNGIGGGSVSLAQHKSCVFWLVSGTAWLAIGGIS